MEMSVSFGTVYMEQIHAYARGWGVGHSKMFSKEVRDYAYVMAFDDFLCEKYPASFLSMIDIRKLVGKTVLMINYGMEQFYFKADGEVAEFLRNDSFGKLIEEFDGYLEEKIKRETSVEI